MAEGEGRRWTQQAPMPPLDGTRLRSLVNDANDGIIATAGIVEGLMGAGASPAGILVAAFAAMVGGGMALGGAKYAEAAAERDAQLVLIEEERRQLDLSPADELAELAMFYEAKGLSPDLAHRVAVELSERDALAAHAEAEHGITLRDSPLHPIIVALSSAIAFAFGSAVVVLTVLLAPDRWRIPSTLVAAVVSLCLTSIVLARWSNVPLVRTITRTVGIGVTAMLVTLAIGSLFDL